MNSVAMQRIAQCGGFLATAEMVLFQLAGGSKVGPLCPDAMSTYVCHVSWPSDLSDGIMGECLQHPAFKIISNLAKESRPDPLPIASLL